MRWLATIVLALLGGFAGAAAWDYSGLGGHSTRNYLLAHPDVLPEVVSHEKSGSAQGVDYARLTALLIEAVKEQEAQIRQLKSEVERLKQHRTGAALR